MSIQLSALNIMSHRPTDRQTDTQPKQSERPTDKKTD